MYILRAILLARQPVRDKQIRTTLFTREYGKITAWEKKENGGDIGSIVEVLVERAQNQNKVQKLTPLSLTDIETWDYETIVSYITLFQILRIALPEGEEQISLFSDMETLLIELSGKKEYTGVGLLQLFLLSKVRILKKLGYLNEAFYLKSERMKGIYNRIDSVSMKSILTSKVLQSTEEVTIEKSVLESIHTYLHKS